MNLAYLVTQNARRFPERIALVWGDKSWTWAEFDARVSAPCGRAAGAGRGPGEARSGSLEEQQRDVRVDVRDVPPRRDLGSDQFPPHAGRSRLYGEQVRSRRSSCARATFLSTPTLSARPHPGRRCLAHRRRARRSDERATGCRADRCTARRTVPNAAVDRIAACWFLFTSGTTGKPKAAVLTHGQMAFVVNNHLCDLLPGTDCSDGSLVVAPLSHGAGVHQLIMVLAGRKDRAAAVGQVLR